MIPASLFGCLLPLADGTQIEVRALEFAPEYFTFRLRHGLGETLVKGAAQLLFFHREKSSYRRIRTEDYKVLLQEDSEYFTVWRFETKDPAYAREVMELTEAYLTYIDLKQTVDDAEVSEAMTGYDVDEAQISEDLSSQRSVWFEGIPPHQMRIPNGVEVGIALADEEIWDHYLDMQLDEFCSWYFRTYCPSKVDYTHVHPGCIQIGNEWCPLHVPDEEKLGQILDRAMEQGLKPMIAFSTMAEHQIPEVKNRIRFLQKWSGRTGVLPELVINDMGMCGMLDEMGEMDFPRTLGILPVRRRKDVRLKWLPQGAQGTQKNQLDDPEYLHVLQKLYRISRVSYENTGDPAASVNHTGLHGTLYLPWYQMNTSTWCTLQAAVREGGRGCQKEIRRCGRDCIRNAFLYPDGLGMVGRYNSLFGLDAEILSANRFLAEAAQRGMDRFIFRFM